MPAIVTPDVDNSVAVHLDATDDLPVADDQVAEDSADADVHVHPELDADAAGAGAADTAADQLLDAEADRRQRLDAMLTYLVPRVDMRDKAKLPPTDFFEADELPFEEKTLLWYYPSGCKTLWGLTDSLMLSCIVSVVAILASTFTLFTYVTTFTMKGLESAEGYSDVLVSMVLTLAPLIAAMLAAFPILDHPLQLVLYYRLWEQKIVIDFKPRGLTDKSTIVKLSVLVLALIGYFTYCLTADFVKDKWAFIVGVTQALGTIAATVYRNASLDSQLQGFNPAFRHYQFRGDQEKEAVSGAGVQLHNRGKARKVIEQVQFVPEELVKYDAIALNYYFLNVLGPKLKSAKKANESLPTAATAAAVAACEEEKQWLKVLAMWVGRLGNNKTTVQARWKVPVVNNHMYASCFVADKNLYDDTLWHATGSFRHRENRFGPTGLAFTGSAVTGVCVIAIEIYGMLLWAYKQANSDATPTLEDSRASGSGSHW